MPNHVTNRLTIIGDENKIKECLNAIKGVWKDYPEDDNRRIDFNKIIPMPEEIKNTQAPNRDEKQAKKLIKKYGCANWYDWSIANWGTKWNAYSFDEYVSEGNVIIFNTAWSTPKPVILALSKKYSELEFEVIYADEDWGHNYGEYTFKNGETIQDERYDVSNGDSDDIVRMLLGAPWWEEEGYNSYDEWLNAQSEEDC